MLTLLAACAGDPLARKRGVRLGFADLEQAAGIAKLQIIVTYNDSRSTHSALRLAHPERGALFWDPGGSYGTVGKAGGFGARQLPVGRKNDLLRADAPTLPTYWRFAVATEDTAMEVLEWNLTAEQADAFYRILLSGAEDGGGADRFKTETAPLYCSVSLSDFLRRYGQGLATADKNYFWPHNLAADLRAQTPHRILVFSRDEPNAIYASTNGSSPPLPPRALPTPVKAGVAAGG